MPRLGFVAALLPEAACLPLRHQQPERLLPLDSSTTLYISGIGAERAEQAVDKLIAHGCDRIISWGTAAGLGKGLLPGDVILPEVVLSSGQTRYETDPGWHRCTLQQLQGCPGAIHTGPLAETGKILGIPAEKRVLQERSRAQAADMESAAIADRTARHGIPFLTVRVIVDSVEMVLPEGITAFTGCYGELLPWRLLDSLARNPRQLPALLRLGLGFRSATSTLKWIGTRYRQLLRNE